MRIATWNVNSVKQRLDHLLTVLDDVRPDVICLQELKCQDEAFPRERLEAAGWRVETHGQKAYNGVALISRHPLEEVQLAWEAQREAAGGVKRVLLTGTA